MIDLRSMPRPLGLTLSGGGSYGATQVGMIMALLEACIVPEIIVGTSVGALNGALLAADPTTAATVLPEVWEGINRRSIVGGPRNVIAHLLRHRDSLSSSQKLVALIEHHIPLATVEALSIDFGAVATRQDGAEPVLLDQGELSAILVASTAIPGLFPPVDIDDTRYVDGGVTANLPIRQTFEKGAASIIALDAMPNRQTPGRGPLGLGMWLAASSFRQQISSAEVKPSDGPVVTIGQVTPVDLSSTDFRRTDRLIALGRAAIEQHLGSSSVRG